MLLIRFYLSHEGIHEVLVRLILVGEVLSCYMLVGGLSRLMVTVSVIKIFLH